MTWKMWGVIKLVLKLKGLVYSSLYFLFVYLQDIDDSSAGTASLQSSDATQGTL